jgi:hypothetical protein
MPEDLILDLSRLKHTLKVSAKRVIVTGKVYPRTVHEGPERE